MKRLSLLPLRLITSTIHRFRQRRRPRNHDETMEIWHLTPDTPRIPHKASAGQAVRIKIGTYPAALGQAVWVEYRVTHLDGTEEIKAEGGVWDFQRHQNNYWTIELGPFADGDTVEYTIVGKWGKERLRRPTERFWVGPKIYLAILWHQHQPLYKDLTAPTPQGSYAAPWVRLHAIRDYYSMAALLENYPDLHLTINLSPCLLWQIEDYTYNRATDKALDLTLKPFSEMTGEERKFVREHFFDANKEHQIFPYPRYRELFEKARRGEEFSDQDIIDLKMWFNLCWFAPEFQRGQVTLPDGSTVTVQPWVEKGRNFAPEEIEEMVRIQYKIMAAVIPCHKALQEKGQLEVSTSPFYHPILPLICDTDQATIDRPGDLFPPRFSYPQDAAAQISKAIDFYQARFGSPPAGMWPPEGAVGQRVIYLFAKYGIRWIASDKGVLKKSGQWGYEVENPEVLSQAYGVRENIDHSWVSIFFRDTYLSDCLGFYYQRYQTEQGAVEDFFRQIKEAFAYRVDQNENRILSIILDGENAWGNYREAGRPLLHLLYQQLCNDPEIRSVTFKEYIEGNPQRNVAPHPIETQSTISHLFTASWIDEWGSLPGNDLGTWIGKSEKNRAWTLLGGVRKYLDSIGATPQSHPAAFEALYAAEGSDWFWWYGGDPTGIGVGEALFDYLFRCHLKAIYILTGQEPPRELHYPLTLIIPAWTWHSPLRQIKAGQYVTIVTNAPGWLHWGVNGWKNVQEIAFLPARIEMAQAHNFRVTIGPFSNEIKAINFTFLWADGRWEGRDFLIEVIG